MLTLLGEPRFDGQSIPLERVTYLIAALACRDEWVSRDELVLLLWPEADANAGRQRLRQLLYRARSFAYASGLEADATRVRLNANSDLRLFREALRAQHWAVAVALYTGPFFQDTHFPDTPELEEFFEFSREEFALGYRRAALSLAANLEPQKALAVLETALERDPLDEAVLRDFLHLAARHDAAAGKRGFARYERATRALGLEADAQLRALSERLEAGGLTPPVWVTQPRTNRLPVPTTGFIGRQTELNDLGERLFAPNARLITILGPGGAGKTRLALELAEQHQGRFRDGASFIELASIGSSELVPNATLEALGLDKGTDARERLLEGLAPRNMLLVLDNLEHLPRIAELVADILGRAPEVRIVTTSREALGLRAEHIIELEGLPVPDSLFPLETQDAALLFLRAAQRVRPDFRFSNDLENFTRIYQAVSGMPLGLELAASWVRAMTLEEIGDELQRGLDVLEVDAPDVPERHRSFAAAFRSSWVLLSAMERESLACLSVFRGGFTREMAQSVAGSNVSLLLRLVNKSLVSRRETRFFLHEMIRQYAERELAPPDRETALAALVQACFELSQQYFENHNSPTQSELSRRLEQEHDNIRSALEWSLHRDPRGGAALAGNLEHFWYTRGHHREGMNWAERFLAQPETATKDETRLWLLWVIVSLAKELSDYQRSKAALEEYSALAKHLAHPQGLASAEKFRGLLEREQGNFQAGREHLERAKDMFTAQGDHNQVGICWNDLGIAEAYLGNLAVARDCFQKSLEIKRKVGDKQGIAYALGNLGLIAGQMGDSALDRVFQEESLRIKRELSDAQGIGNSLQNLGAFAMTDQNYQLAREHYRESLEIFLRLGRRWTIAHLLVDFANLERRLNVFDRALRLVGAAEEAMRRIGSSFPKSCQNMIAAIRHEAPFSEAQRTKYEFEGERMSLEEAALYAMSAAPAEANNTQPARKA